MRHKCQICLPNVSPKGGPAESRRLGGLHVVAPGLSGRKALGAVVLFVVAQVPKEKVRSVFLLGRRYRSKIGPRKFAARVQDIARLPSSVTILLVLFSTLAGERTRLQIVEDRRMMVLHSQKTDGSHHISYEGVIACFLLKRVPHESVSPEYIAVPPQEPFVQMDVCFTCSRKIALVNMLL